MFSGQVERSAYKPSVTEQIDDIFLTADFGEDFLVRPATDSTVAYRYAARKLSIDPRDRYCAGDPSSKGDHGSFKEGLFFDPSRLSTRTYTLFDTTHFECSIVNPDSPSFEEGRHLILPLQSSTVSQAWEEILSMEADAVEQAIGLNTKIEEENVRYIGFRAVGTFFLGVMPHWWIDNQRYVKAIAGENCAEIINASSLLSPTPHYIISPGWIRVADEYLHQFTQTLYKVMTQSLQTLGAAAPGQAVLQIIAQGKDASLSQPKDERLRLQREKRAWIRDQVVGKKIAVANLPFLLEDIGVAGDDSRFLVRLAEKMGMIKLDSVGSMNTLGPVFVKEC